MRIKKESTTKSKQGMAKQNKEDIIIQQMRGEKNKTQFVPIPFPHPSIT